MFFSYGEVTHHTKGLKEGVFAVGAFVLTVCVMSSMYVVCAIFYDCLIFNDWYPWCAWYLWLLCHLWWLISTMLMLPLIMMFFMTDINYINDINDTFDYCDAFDDRYPWRQWFPLITYSCVLEDCDVWSVHLFLGDCDVGDVFLIIMSMKFCDTFNLNFPYEISIKDSRSGKRKSLGSFGIPIYSSQF